MKVRESPGSVSRAAVSSRRIRFVIFRESDHWVGQCLEFDIGVQGKTLQQIQRRIPIALNCDMQESMVRYKIPFSGLDAAPAYFRKRWARRSGEYVPLRPLKIPGMTVTVGLCEYSPVGEDLQKLPTFARYCAWVASAGSGVEKHIFVADDGSTEVVTKVTASTVNWALEIGTLDGDRLALTTIARLDRRLGLQSLFSYPANVQAPLGQSRL